MQVPLTPDVCMSCVVTLRVVLLQEVDTTTWHREDMSWLMLRNMRYKGYEVVVVAKEHNEAWGDRATPLPLYMVSQGKVARCTWGLLKQVIELWH